MDAYTRGMCEALAARINDTLGAPLRPMNDAREHNIGHHSIERANGVYSFARTATATGGTHTLFIAKGRRELYKLMDAYLDGIRIAQQIKEGAPCEPR